MTRIDLDMKDIGKEIKSYTELNGRTESNLIDTLNALYNYDVSKHSMFDYLDRKDH